MGIEKRYKNPSNIACDIFQLQKPPPQNTFCDPEGISSFCNYLSVNDLFFCKRYAYFLTYAIPTISNTMETTSPSPADRKTTFTALSFFFPI